MMMCLIQTESIEASLYCLLYAWSFPRVSATRKLVAMGESDNCLLSCVIDVIRHWLSLHNIIEIIMMRFWLETISHCVIIVEIMHLFGKSFHVECIAVYTVPIWSFWTTRVHQLTFPLPMSRWNVIPLGQ